MKRSPILRTLALTAILALTATACDDGKEGGVFTEPPATDTFELIYVSGHLGSYWDCPGDALSGPATTGSAPMADAAAEPGFAGAAERCDGDNCGGPWIMNCEHAELTIRLKNTGETTLTGLQVSQIVLMPESGEGSVESELLDATRSDGQPMATGVAPGEEIELIVQFKGLPPNFDMSWFEDAATEVPAGSWADSAFPTMFKVEVEVSTDKKAETVESPGLQALPMVAT